MYAGRFKNPIIVISLVLPGNTYPVTENPESKNTLRGKPLKRGYQSHYVSVKSNGKPTTNEEISVYDELVINQSTQAVPVFAIVLKRNQTCSKGIIQTQQKTEKLIRPESESSETSQKIQIKLIKRSKKLKDSSTSELKRSNPPITRNHPMGFMKNRKKLVTTSKTQPR